MAFPTQAERAEAIRAQATQSYDRVRGNKLLNQDAVKASIAKTYVQARAEMAALRETHMQNVATEKHKLTRAAFGVDSFGTTDSTRAQAAISFRDAQDRVEKLENPTQAQRLLQRANDSGDELLARAVAQHAFGQTRLPAGLGAAWAPVVEDYAASRPESADVISRLDRMDTNGGEALMAEFLYSVPPPSEVGGMNEHHVRALADSDLAAAS